MRRPIIPKDFIIDDDLLELAMSLSGHRTRREVVNEALLEYVQRHKRLKALETIQTIEFDKDFDYKRARSTR